MHPKSIVAMMILFARFYSTVKRSPKYPLGYGWHDGLGFDIASRCQDGASQLGRRERDRVEEELGDVVRAQMQQLVVRIGLRHLEGLVGASLAVEV
jgi:hypothetical protein